MEEHSKITFLFADTHHQQRKKPYGLISTIPKQQAKLYLFQAKIFMSRTARLFNLIQILRRHRFPVSGKLLAEELGISLRTLYRDIASLKAQGAEIEGDPGGCVANRRLVYNEVFI